jgi:hypothetical protein
MGTWNGQKLAGAAGVVFIVATLVSAFIVSPPPSPDESAAKFVEYYSDNRTVLLVQMIIAVLADIPAFLFIAGFWQLLRREEGEAGILATATVVAFIVGGAVVTVASGWLGALAYLGDGNGLDEGSARTLSLLGTLSTTSGIFAAFAATEAASGYVLLKGTVLPKWLGWIGLAAAVLALVAVFAVAKSGDWFIPFGIFSFAGFLSFSAYVVLVSVFMWLRPKANSDSVSV